MPKEYGFATEDCVDFGDGACDGTVEDYASLTPGIWIPHCVRHRDIYLREAGRGLRVEIDGVPLLNLLPGSNRRF